MTFQDWSAYVSSTGRFSRHTCPKKYFCDTYLSMNDTQTACTVLYPLSILSCGVQKISSKTSVEQDSAEVQRTAYHKSSPTARSSPWTRKEEIQTPSLFPYVVSCDVRNVWKWSRRSSTKHHAKKSGKSYSETTNFMKQLYEASHTSMHASEDYASPLWAEWATMEDGALRRTTEIEQ